ncbi:hypothetical protein AU196_02830 [Mycobacterium sp. IS-1742]|uniref:toll/interleukin-1 receptor domain-containing protein n=1 Tax=Mycobacterium sp. IS-1742 TaxID=1772285 RepID=UPI00073FC33C|nr:toll/interleukin-1 receptor domain-containing protein [Mycobacterium sp. IS-1742]KUI26563.1 hypothetical protein AU196_02830 [Mycobacterium sp. IS-1742]
MKVFLSHASADKPTVRAIAQALSDSQIEVWLDEADIRVGESIPEGITAGLVGSDLLLLVFSRQALQSRWVKRELHAFYMMAMSSGKPIIPCRLDDSDPPVLLADIKYADFRDDFSVGMTAVLGAVGIAEEISASRTAVKLAETVGDSLSAEQRRRCYDLLIAEEVTLYDEVVVPTTPTRALEVAALFGNELHKFNLLVRSGLIEVIKHDHPIKRSYVATPMGRRVFLLWAAEASSST